MEEKKESFHYTYSAKQQEEIQSIRKKYLPQEDKMEQLRRLDLPAAGDRHVLHHGLDAVVCPGGCDRGDRNCGHRGSVPAVYPHHQARAGTAGAADFEADRGAFPGGIKKEEQQKFFCCSSFWYQARGRESTGFPPRLAVSASGPALFCAGEAERPRQRPQPPQ